MQRKRACRFASPFGFYWLSVYPPKSILDLHCCIPQHVRSPTLREEWANLETLEQSSVLLKGESAPMLISLGKNAPRDCPINATSTKHQG